MGWMQKLYDTYEQCQGSKEPKDLNTLLPIAHSTQQAQIEISLNGQGAFRRARVVIRDSNNSHITLIPCTEESASRSGSKPRNHPLCDKLQYIAGDFFSYGGIVTKGFLAHPEEPYQKYLKDLELWEKSSFTHPMLSAILHYVKQGKVIEDLVREGILSLDIEKKVIQEWDTKSTTIPAIFSVIKNPMDAFVRWRVEFEGQVNSATWENQELITAWQHYYLSSCTSKGLCYVMGLSSDGQEVVLSGNHPNKIRNDGDKAKLISSNDTAGYTFRGRFLDAEEACGVGFEVSQKAHGMLKWLIRRQGYVVGGKDPLVYVAWQKALSNIPAWQNTDELMDFHRSSKDTEFDEWDLIGDVGQNYAIRLKKALQGFRTDLKDTQEIMVIGLDSATPGRLAIVYYREIQNSEFLERVLQWHENFAWFQDYGQNKGKDKPRKFIGAPSPKDITEAAYGLHVDDALKKATVKRLIPCIIDAQPFPKDLMTSVVHRACNCTGMDPWEWRKCLGIACALFKGFYHKERSYKMALEEDRDTRAYLYGRLLAVADDIESLALHIAKEERSTNAARLMQRFADRPYSTWRTIALALIPYKTRLQNNRRGGFLYNMETLITEINDKFRTDNSNEIFTNDAPLEGEFLLGYYCQRKVFLDKMINGKTLDEEIGE